MSVVEVVNVFAVMLLVIVVVALLRFATVLHELVDKMHRNVASETARQAQLVATVDRMEAAAAVVAKNLATAAAANKIREQRVERTIDRMERATEVVAQNLAAANQAATDTNGSPGEAADAYSRGPEQ